MGLIDINSCTARQLTEYARIGKSLADSIIRYRRCFGGYKHFDEIWKITGISRASYRNLKQYFYVEKEKTPAVGERLPNEKLSITDSMLHFLTQNEISHRKKKQDITSVRDRAKEDASQVCRPTKREVKSAKQGNIRNCKPVDVDKGQCYSVEGLLKTQDCDDSRISVPKNPPGDLIKWDELLTTEQPSMSKCVWEQSKTFVEENKKCSLAVGDHPIKDNTGASVVLMASTSGNNINVTCTFDKNLLNCDSPIAIKLNQDRVDSTENHQTTEQGRREVDKRRNQRIGGCKSKLEAVNCNKVESDRNANEKLGGRKSHTASTERKTYENGKKNSTDAEVVDLNRENLSAFTQEKHVSSQKKRKLLEAWIEEVNIHLERDSFEYSHDQLVNASGMQKRPSPSTVPAGSSLAAQKQMTSNPIAWQLQTKSIPVHTRPATAMHNQKKPDKDHMGPMQCETALKAINMSGLWTRLRTIASGPFKNLYEHKCDNLPPPSPSPRLDTKSQTKKAQMLQEQSSRIRHGFQNKHSRHRAPADNMIPELIQSKRSITFHSSSSSNLPRKSARSSVYVNDNTSHQSSSPYEKG